MNAMQREGSKKGVVHGDKVAQDGRKVVDPILARGTSRVEGELAKVQAGVDVGRVFPLGLGRRGEL